MLTLAKSLCGGLAGGALLAKRDIAPSLRPGMHASTFGGNPIAAAAGIAMLETIESDGLLQVAKENAATFAEHLSSLMDRCSSVREVRQLGLMIGIELEFDGAEIVQSCLERGLLINCTQRTTLRLLPAMNIAKEQIDRGMELLTQCVLEATQENGRSVSADQPHTGAKALA